MTCEEVLALARERPLAEVAEAVGRSSKRTREVLVGRSAPRDETRHRAPGIRQSGVALDSQRQGPPRPRGRGQPARLGGRLTAKFMTRALPA